MNDKIYVKGFENHAVDYYINPRDVNENGLIGNYYEYDIEDGVKFLCRNFESELAYVGYAKTAEELENLVKEWGEESGEGSDWAINEFTGENHYCMVFCEGQDKGGAFQYDYAIDLFYDETHGEVMLGYLLDKYSQNLIYWNAWDLREFIMDLMDIKLYSQEEQELDSLFEEVLNISLDDYDGDLSKALGQFEAADAWSGVKHMIRFNHIDFERVNF